MCTKPCRNRARYNRCARFVHGPKTLVQQAKRVFARNFAKTSASSISKFFGRVDSHVGFVVFLKNRAEFPLPAVQAFSAVHGSCTPVVTVLDFRAKQCTPAIMPHFGRHYCRNQQNTRHTPPPRQQQQHATCNEQEKGTNQPSP